jgi:hypothetical protein
MDGYSREYDCTGPRTGAETYSKHTFECKSRYMDRHVCMCGRGDLGLEEENADNARADASM